MICKWSNQKEDWVQWWPSQTTMSKNLPTTQHTFSYTYSAWEKVSQYERCTNPIKSPDSVYAKRFKDKYTIQYSEFIKHVEMCIYVCCNWFLESSHCSCLPRRFHGDLLIIFSNIVVNMHVHGFVWNICLFAQICFVFFCDVRGQEKVSVMVIYIYSSRIKSGNEQVSCCRSIRSLTSQLLLRYEKPGEKKHTPITDCFSQRCHHTCSTHRSLFSLHKKRNVQLLGTTCTNIL